MQAHQPQGSGAKASTPAYRVGGSAMSLAQ